MKLVEPPGCRIFLVGLFTPEPFCVTIDAGWPFDDGMSEASFLKTGVVFGVRTSVALPGHREGLVIMRAQG
jgi:hypothetical protein